jgi:hypothetical protein
MEIKIQLLDEEEVSKSKISSLVKILSESSNNIILSNY